ncbi:hypothetical protein ACFV84_36105 [Kitasatospora sp. NPDC059811]|uniref:hypothetical protein n=1 Tax=Streptomycetaceae TaxID=2062 RepID=UPI0013312F81|nr:hypothetical protein [Streptomyces sp. MJM8645]
MAKSQTRCPECKGTLVRLYTTGDVKTSLLVDVADPDAGVLAVVVDEDADNTRKISMMICASCEHWPGEHPRMHGYPLFKAATAIWGAGRWPAAALWECTDYNTRYFSTRLEHLVCARDIERGYASELDCWCRPRWPHYTKNGDEPGRGPDPIPPGQELDHVAPRPAATAGVVNGLTTPAPPTVDEAAQAVRDALAAVDTARAVLAKALRREQTATGASANELAKRVEGTMSRPLVLKALNPVPTP